MAREFVVEHLLSDAKSCSAYQLKDFHDAVRCVLSQRLGQHNARLLSSYSLRRALPIVAMVVGVGRYEWLALGSWVDTLGAADKTTIRSADMSVRYAGDKDTTSLFAKSKFSALTREACEAGIVSLADCRCWLVDADVAAIGKEAERCVLGAVTLEEVLRCQVEHIVVVTRTLVFRNDQSRQQAPRRWVRPFLLVVVRLRPMWLVGCHPWARESNPLRK